MLRPRATGILGELLGQFNRDDSFVPSPSVPYPSRVPYNVDHTGSSARTFGKALDQFNMSQSPTPLSPPSLRSQREPFRPPVNLGDTSAVSSGVPANAPMGQRITSLQVTPRIGDTDMGGAGVTRPGADVMGMEKLAEQAAKAVKIEQERPEIAAQPGFMKTVTDFFGDRENMLRLAAGFNAMTLRPDTGLASIISSELEDIRAQRLIAGSANKTVQSLRSIGTPEAITAANMIEANPTMAKTIFSEYVEKSMKGDEELIKDEGDLRKEYTSNPTIKRFSDQSAAFGRMAASAVEASPAGDLALIYNFMKLLDPGSTVMQGEFETTARAGGYGERIKGYVENLQKGTTLTPSQRADFMDRANKLYGSAAGDYEKTREKYVDIAGQYKYDVDRTVPDFYSQNQQRINPSISYSDLPAETKQKFPTEESWNQYFQQLNYLQKLELVEAL